MTFTRLLDINRNLVRPGAEASIDFAARIWLERGSPTDPGELAEAIEEALTRCVERGMYYAPILLQRKKMLERGAWKPRSLEPLPAPAKAPDGRPAQAGSCVHCGGAGTYVLGFTGYLCPCGAWQKRGSRQSASANAAGCAESAATAEHDSARGGALESLGEVISRTARLREQPAGERP